MTGWRLHGDLSYRVQQHAHRLIRLKSPYPLERKLEPLTFNCLKRHYTPIPDMFQRGNPRVMCLWWTNVRLLRHAYRRLFKSVQRSA
jgi:hypothetical protein